MPLNPAYPALGGTGHDPAGPCFRYVWMEKEFMRRITVLLVILATVASIALSSHGAQSKDDPWREVDRGLYIGEFTPREKAKVNDSKITIVKADPRVYSFKLFCASEHGKIKMTAKEWCQKHNLLSAINAGMYQEDGIRNVGYMKNFGHINNPKLNAAYKAVLAFNPIEAVLPEIQIIDLKCQDFERLRSKYQTLVQNIRMISCRQENVWGKQDKIWSMAVFGIDKGGNALLIFTESPYSGYEFAYALLSLPISIYSAMYLEGGQQANLYFSANDVEFDRIGRPISLDGSDRIPAARPIPNVIGIAKRPKRSGY